MSSPVRKECFLNDSQELSINQIQKVNGSLDLPAEIFIEIFRYLKGEELYNASLVCKYWQNHVYVLNIKPMNSFIQSIKKIGLNHFYHCIEKPIEELGPNPNLKKMEEVLKNGFVNLKIKNSVVEFRHPFLTKEILETSQLLFKANVCLGLLLHKTSEIFYLDPTLPTTQEEAIQSMTRCCTLLLKKGVANEAFSIIKKIPKDFTIRNALLQKTVIHFLKRNDVSSAQEALNLINNVYWLYNTYSQFCAFFAQHGEFQEAMTYASLIQAEGIFFHSARKAYREIFHIADMDTSLTLISKIKNKRLYLEMFELILLNHSNTSNTKNLVDLLNKLVKKKNHNSLLQNVCRILVLNNNTELANAIAESFPNKSKRKDYSYSGISIGLLISKKISESIMAAKLIRGKTLRTEILKSNALIYASESIYYLYNSGQNMLNEDLLKDLSKLLNVITSKSEKNPALETIIYYYRDCNVNDEGLEQIRNTLNSDVE